MDVANNLIEKRNNADDNKLYFKVAEIPGWQSYNFPELDQLHLNKSH